MIIAFIYIYDFSTSLYMYVLHIYSTSLPSPSASTNNQTTSRRQEGDLRVSGELEPERLEARGRSEVAQRAGGEREEELELRRREEEPGPAAQRGRTGSLIRRPREEGA